MIRRLFERRILQAPPAGTLPLPEGICSVCGILIPKWDKECPSPDPSIWLHDYRAVLIREKGGYILSPVLTASEDGVGLQYAQRKAGICSSDTPKGYTIHSRCWDLLNLVMRRITNTRTTSPRLETRLQNFTQVLESTQVRELFSSIPSTAMFGDGRWLFTLQKLEFYIPHSPQVSHNSDFLVLSDPFNILEVHEAIAESTWSLESRERSTPKARRIIPPLDTFLPVELTCMIFDFLGPEDVRKVLESGEWGLPDFYWRGRLCETFFELDDVVPDEVDWQKMWLALEPLKETSKEVFNRQRLMRIFRKFCCKFIEVDRKVARDEDIHRLGVMDRIMPWDVKSGLVEDPGHIQGKKGEDEEPTAKRRRVKM